MTTSEHILVKMQYENLSILKVCHLVKHIQYLALRHEGGVLYLCSIAGK